MTFIFYFYEKVKFMKTLKILQVEFFCGKIVALQHLSLL
jgi:hypothetical protein